MTATLYVDVDDTLVHWLGHREGPHPYGIGAERWEKNEGVFAVADEWLRSGRRVVVWSGGGAEYAGLWAQRFWPNWPTGLEYAAKWPKVPMPDDVFIDDCPMASFARQNIHPGEIG